MMGPIFPILIFPGVPPEDIKGPKEDLEITRLERGAEEFAGRKPTVWHTKSFKWYGRVYYFVYSRDRREVVFDHTRKESRGRSGIRNVTSIVFKRDTPGRIQYLGSTIFAFGSVFMGIEFNSTTGVLYILPSDPKSREEK